MLALPEIVSDEPQLGYDQGETGQHTYVLQYLGT